MDQQKQSQKPHPQPPGENEPHDATQDSSVLDDEVDEASEESFPASDPPAWTRSTTSRDLPRDHEGH